MSKAVSSDTSTSGFEEPTDEVFGRVIPVNILKGGAGKSTISLNLADRLAARENDVLYVDLDPNGHVTDGLGYESAYDDTESEYALRRILIHSENKFGEAIHETEHQFDFVPSNRQMEVLDTELKNAKHGSKRLLNNFLKPLIINDHYDYVVIDGGGESSRIADNAFRAARQMIIPIEPGGECYSGFKQTMTRVVKEFRQYQPFRILAIVPNKLSQTIKHQTTDRTLIEDLNRSEKFARRLPNFARVTEEEFERIDNGDISPPKPGLREDVDFKKAYNKGMSLSEHNPSNDMIERLDELAQIVEDGGIKR